MIRDVERFFELLFSDRYEVIYFTFLTQDIALVQWRDGPSFISSPNKTGNCFISAFVTAYGRLHLYSYLERLNSIPTSILYMDTDSLIYLSHTGEPLLPLGNNLGELTSELKNDDFIKLFLSSGPKSYCFLSAAGDVVLKCKGLTQTYEAVKSINFSSMQQMIENYVNRLEHPHDVSQSDDGDDNGDDFSLCVTQRGIKRAKDGFVMHNVKTSKRIKIVFDKRRVIRGGGTLPFGF